MGCWRPVSRLSQRVKGDLDGLLRGALHRVQTRISAVGNAPYSKVQSLCPVNDFLCVFLCVPMFL